MVTKPSTTAWLGTLLLAASATAYSTAGFYTRLIEIDVWTMLFWRGVFGGLLLAGMVVWREHGRILRAVRAIGRDGVLIACCSAIATVCFINAMRRSSVADVLVIDATIPFLTAGIACLVIGEREDKVTLLSSLVALAGDFALLGLFGMSQFGLGLLLLALGTPLVSATRGALISVLQTPLGTLWVWFAFAEAPTPATLVGGLIVMAAVVGDIVAPRPEERSLEQPATASPAYRQTDGR